MFEIRERERRGGRETESKKNVKKTVEWGSCTNTLNLKKPKEINVDEVGAIGDKYERNDKFTHFPGETETQVTLRKLSGDGKLTLIWVFKNRY